MIRQSSFFRGGLFILSGKRRASRHYDRTLRGLAKSGLSEQTGRSSEVTVSGLSTYTFPLNLMASKSADAQEFLNIYVCYLCGRGLTMSNFFGTSFCNVMTNISISYIYLQFFHFVVVVVVVVLSRFKLHLIVRLDVTC